MPAKPLNYAQIGGLFIAIEKINYPACLGFATVCPVMNAQADAQQDRNGIAPVIGGMRGHSRTSAGSVPPRMPEISAGHHMLVWRNTPRVIF